MFGKYIVQRSVDFSEYFECGELQKYVNLVRTFGILSFSLGRLAPRGLQPSTNPENTNSFLENRLFHMIEAFSFSNQMRRIALAIQQRSREDEGNMTSDWMDAAIGSRAQLAFRVGRNIPRFHGRPAATTQKTKIA